MKVSQENTAIVIQNARAEGQTSRADYIELMDGEITRLQAQVAELQGVLLVREYDSKGNCLWCGQVVAFYGGEDSWEDPENHLPNCLRQRALASDGGKLLEVVQIIAWDDYGRCGITGHFSLGEDWGDCRCELKSGHSGSHCIGVRKQFAAWRGEE